MEFKEWCEVEEWIDNNIYDGLVDDDVNRIYALLFRFDKGLLKGMLNEASYKLALKYLNVITPSLIDRDSILYNLKDLLLVGGSQNYSLDDYIDWDRFVQDEIDAYYEAFEGDYISCDELREFCENVKRNCIL